MKLCAHARAHTVSDAVCPNIFGASLPALHRKETIDFSHVSWLREAKVAAAAAAVARSLRSRRYLYAGRENEREGERVIEKKEKQGGRGGSSR